MFGIVHRAFKEMIVSRYGEEKWRDMLINAQQLDESYLRTNNYPDQQLGSLVAESSAVLGRESSGVVQEFGHYWYHYTLQDGYRDLVDACGNSLPEFLQNLNDMHAKIGVLFPGMKAPIFKCMDITDHSLILHYYSTREGFGPVVVGAVEAIAQRFNTPVTITRLQQVEAGADHDSYLIEY